MSRIVIGGAHFRNSEFGFVSKILDHAHDLGVDLIDTAPSYGNSEYLIGKYLKINRNFRVNTKIGRPNPSDFTPIGIEKSVDRSLHLLKVEQIHTLFIHSLSPEYLNYENLEALNRIKKKGKANFIGYSGDGTNLQFANGIVGFDSFMATFNPIDIENSKLLLKMPETKDIYLKRILAGGVWKKRFRSEVKKKLMINLWRSGQQVDLDSYNFRFKEIFGAPKYLTSHLKHFVKFSLSLHPEFL